MSLARAAITLMRFGCSRTDSAYLCAAELACELAHELRDGRRGVAGIAAEPHRRGARVVRLPRDPQLLPGNPLQVLDRADGDALRVQDGPLLDVQLHECMRRPSARLGIAGIADALELVAEPSTVDRAGVERLGKRQAAGVDEGAQHIRLEACALLIGEDADGKRAPSNHAGLVERLHHLERAEHAVIAVIASTGAHGVDMRPAHHRRQFLASAALRDDVADCVDPHLESELAHPAENKIASGLVVVGERETTTGAVLALADLRETVEPPPKAWPVCSEIADTHDLLPRGTLRHSGAPAIPRVEHPRSRQRAIAARGSLPENGSS